MLMNFEVFIAYCCHIYKWYVLYLRCMSFETETCSLNCPSAIRDRHGEGRGDDGDRAAQARYSLDAVAKITNSCVLAKSWENVLERNIMQDGSSSWAKGSWRCQATRVSKGARSRRHDQLAAGRSAEHGRRWGHSRPPARHPVAGSIPVARARLTRQLLEHLLHFYSGHIFPADDCAKLDKICAKSMHSSS